MASQAAMICHAQKWYLERLFRWCRWMSTGPALMPSYPSWTDSSGKIQVMLWCNMMHDDAQHGAQHDAQHNPTICNPKASFSWSQSARSGHNSSRPGRDGLAAGFFVPSARYGTHPADGRGGLRSRAASASLRLQGATADGATAAPQHGTVGFLCTIASGKDEAWNQSRWPN